MDNEFQSGLMGVLNGLKAVEISASDIFSKVEKLREHMTEEEKKTVDEKMNEVKNMFVKLKEEKSKLPI